MEPERMSFVASRVVPFHFTMLRGPRPLTFSVGEAVFEKLARKA